MKASGIILLLLACIGYGYAAAYSLRTRLKAAEDYCLLFGEIKNEIRFSHKTVAEIVQKISAVNKSPHIPKLLDAVGTHGVDNEKLKEYFVNTKTDAELTETMLYFFNNLGKSDLDGQLSLCELSKTSADTILIRLRETTARKAKLTQSLSILLGAAIAVLLI